MAGNSNGPATNVVKLSKAIATHKGNTAEITFAPFTADLLIRHGRFPFKTVYGPAGNPIDLETDYTLAAKFIADLTGLDEVILGALNPLDFGKLVIHLRDVAMTQGN